VVDIAAEQTIDGGSGQESDVLATVVATGQTGLAGVTNDVGLDSDAIADLEVGDIGSDSEDLTGRLVAENVVAGDNHGADAPCVPEVDIGSMSVSFFVSGLARSA
jgi:hypothetical protein